MIINKKGLRAVLNAKSNKGILLRTIFKNFSITKLNIDEHFLHNKLKISPQTQEIKIEFILNNIKDKNLQINLTEEKITNELNNKQEENLNSENSLTEKLFVYEYNKDENKIIINNKPFDDQPNDIHVNLIAKANLLLNIKRSKNIKINAFNKYINEKNTNLSLLFEAKENSNSFELSCEESKINITNSLVYSNIIINSIKSEIKCEGLYAFKRKPFSNFKLFEESFLKTNQIKYSEENSTNEINQIKNNPVTNESKDITIFADNSKIEIETIKNFSKLLLRTNEKEENTNSTIKIDYVETRNFDIELKNPNDKLKINLYHLFENSIFKMKNVDFKYINIKMHPMLLFNLNVYNTNKGKFQKNLIFDNEGYSFCPTVVFEIDKEFPKNYLVGYELVKISKYFKWFMFVMISMFFTKIIFLSNNSLENWKDFEANLNTLDNLPRQISEYKFYQLAMRKKFDKLLDNIDK